MTVPTLTSSCHIPVRLVSTSSILLATLTLTIIITTSLSTVVGHAATHSIVLEVTPRIVSTDGTLRIKLVQTSPEYETVAVRLEGPSSTGYMTLSAGSIVAIDLSTYRLPPGLYYVTAYDTPGGKRLTSVPVLLVNVKLTFTPPRPSIGQEFLATPLIEPPGYDYRITIKVDNKIIGETEPGTGVKLRLDTRGPHTICIDISANIQGQIYNEANVTCTQLVLNVPPTIGAQTMLEGNYITLLLDVRDPDGVLISASYNCTIDGLTWSGYLPGGISRVKLLTIDDAYTILNETSGLALLKCTISAVDDSGARATKLLVERLADILAATTIEESNRQTGTPKRTAQKETATTTQASHGGSPPLPSEILIPLAAIIPLVGGLAALFILRKKKMGMKQKTAPPKPARERTAVEQSREELANVIARLDKLERQMEELIGIVGELRGEVDELRSHVKKLEERRR
ncbi:hypothetical protein Pyrfu_1460 [Pyrolobus fumarii 1A]|uniref:Uncharacterized protein n=1 Tax=Pyrolobus fumarii (strain DSM 11204 / 1A) TaxID=694429 RepID=G0EH94_PYRF1